MRRVQCGDPVLDSSRGFLAGRVRELRCIHRVQAHSPRRGEHSAATWVGAAISSVERSEHHRHFPHGTSWNSRGTSRRHQMVSTDRLTGSV